MSNDFLFDRPPIWGPDLERVTALWTSLRSPAGISHAPNEYPELAPGFWSVDEIRPLLNDGDPKVRTLGIILIYQLNRIDVLPDLVPLAYDDSETFAAPAAIDNPIVPWPMEKQTVGGFARAAICAFSCNVDPPDDRPVAEQTRTLRCTVAEFVQGKDPVQCFEAIKVAMRRATQSSGPPESDRIARVHAVFDLIQRQPVEDRFGLLNTFSENLREWGLDTSGELLSLARQLPREARLKRVEPKRMTNLPDVYSAIEAYFVDHAPELFRSSDADLFLGFAKQMWNERHGADTVALGGQYAIMAAKLRPADADAILLAEMDRAAASKPIGNLTQEELSIAMANLGIGDRCLGRSLDCFFALPELCPAQRSQEAWLQTIAKNPVRARKFCERIIRDPRLDQLDLETTKILLNWVGGYLGRSLATKKELAEPNGPVDPKPGAPMLNRWHAALRDTVEEWAK